MPTSLQAVRAACERAIPKSILNRVQPMSGIPQPQEEHIPLALLWESRMQQRSMTPPEILHILKCDECLSLLGLCQIAKSVQQVEQLRDESR